MRTLLKLPSIVALSALAPFAAQAQEEPESAPAVPPDLGEIDSKAAKIPVYLVENARAEIDGVEQKALGISITDSLSKGLLADHRAKVSFKDPDFSLQPTLAGHDGTYRLTVRKVGQEGDEIVEIYSATTDESSPDVFALVEEILDQILPGRANIEERNALALPELDGPRMIGRLRPRFVPRKPPPQIVHPVVYERPEYVRRRVGVVKAVNDSWEFVIIKPDSGSGIRDWETLEILYNSSEGTIPYAKLEVERSDRGNLIANFGGDPRGDRVLFPGEVVYAWRTK